MKREMCSWPVLSVDGIIFVLIIEMNSHLLSECLNVPDDFLCGKTRKLELEIFSSTAAQVTF